MKLDLKIFVLAIVVVGVLGYAYYRIADLLQGPRIFLTAPENGATITSSLIETHGTVKNAVVFTINGHTTEIDTNGIFSKTVLLAIGYNEIELYAEGRFGKSTVKRIEVVRR